MTTLDKDIQSALLFVESLHCDTCKQDVNFWLGIVPHCVKCDSPLKFTYEDLKPVGMLPDRAGIKRYRKPIKLS